MKFPLRYTFVLFLIITVLHFVANSTSLYETRIVWFDNVLHTLAGVGFGLFWLWVLEKKSVHHSFTFSAISLVAFVLGTALVWELLEFLFFKLFTQYAYNLSLYSPSRGEAGMDIASNLVGAFILILIIKYTYGKRNTTVSL